MTPPTPAKPRRRRVPASNAAAAAHAPDYTFGVTLDQIDRFHALLRTISAHSDMVAVCSGGQLDDESLSTLGESIFEAAGDVRGLVDAIYAQRLPAGGTAGAPVDRDA